MMDCNYKAQRGGKHQLGSHTRLLLFAQRELVVVAMVGRSFFNVDKVDKHLNQKYIPCFIVKSFVV